MNMNFALEPQIQFFCEQQTEVYLDTAKEQSQQKIGYEAKNLQARQAWLGLRGGGA